MARASEKKAAAQKAEIISFWKPILVIINSLYMIIRMYIIGGIVSTDLLVSRGSKILELCGLSSTLFLQYYAYLGILDDAVNPKRDKKALVGGANLDLLAFALLVQYSTILLSVKFYYLLVAVPIWGGWYIYKTFFRGDTTTKATSLSSSSNDDATADQSDNPKSQRQQQRADKRRQKWS